MRRALQLVAAFAAIGLVLAGALASREILGATAPAFAWPSPRGLVLGYPASFVDFAADSSATADTKVSGAS